MPCMTSRERVLAALNFRQPDRVPVDFSGHRSSGIAAIAYARLKRELGIATGDIYVYDMLQQLAIVEPPVLERFSVDVVEMGRGFCRNAADWRDWVLPDGTPCKVPAYLNLERHGDDWMLHAADGTPMAVMKKGMLYFEQIHFPLMERGIEDDDFHDLPQRCAKTMWAGVPHPGAHFPLDAAGLATLAAGARWTREESGGRAVVGLFGANMFELPHWLYRMDNYLLYMALYPEAIHHTQPWRRICLPAGPQYYGQRAAPERHGDVRRHCRVWHALMGWPRFAAGTWSVFNIDPNGKTQLDINCTALPGAATVGYAAMMFGPYLPQENLNTLTKDTTTKGRWINVYGADGYVLNYYDAPLGAFNSTLSVITNYDVRSALPSYVTSYQQSGGWAYQPEVNSASAGCLQDPRNPRGGRNGAITYSDTITFTIGLAANARPFKLATYHRYPTGDGQTWGQSVTVRFPNNPFQGSSTDGNDFRS